MTTLKSVYAKEDAPQVDGDTSTVVTFERTSIKKNVIEGVHLIGTQAKNRVRADKAPYTYKESALMQAVALYENVDVYLSHGEGNKKRTIEEKIGYVANPRYVAGTGVVGDIVLNEEHAYTKAMLWWADNKPDKLGMSHVATNLYSESENAIVEIKKVHSVDIVDDPSTTNGLFKEGVVMDKVSETMLETLWEAATSLVWRVQYPLEGNKLPMAERAVKIISVIEDLATELRKISPTTQTQRESTMEYVDIKLEDLKEKRADLVTAIHKEAVDNHIAVEAKVAEAVKDIPEATKTKVFIKLVREAVVAADATTLAELIEDRKSLVTTTVVESAPPVTPRLEKKQTQSTEVDIVALAKKKN